MTFVFLIAVFNAFFFLVLLAQKRPREHHDNILIAWLIYLGLFIGIYSVYSHELFVHFGVFSNSFLSLFMLHGPFLYLYISALISESRPRMMHILIHLMPFLLFNLYIIYSSFNPALAEEVNIDRVSGDYDIPVLYKFFLILTALSGPFYFLLSMRLFRKMDSEILNDYSSMKVSPGWLKKLIIVFGIVWTSLIIVTIVHHVFNMFSMVFCTDGLFLSLSVFVILIGYFGLKQRVILSFGEVNHGTTGGKVKYAGSKLVDKDSERYQSELSAYMMQEKPYLNPELTLAQLAESTGIPSYHLSQVINERFKKNFFDFINSYRVEAFKAMVADSKYSNLSLLGVAFECGFNSKTAFNRVFRQVTGTTPSEYKKNLLKK